MRKIFKAFTVLELVIVVVIIGILSAVVYIGYGGIQAQARDASVLSDLDTLDGLMTDYALRNNVAGKAVYLEGGVTDTDLDFTPSEGNVIDVVIDDTDYCIRGYNPSGTKDNIMNAFEKDSGDGICDILSPSGPALTDYYDEIVYLELSAGNNHNCAIASDNQAYCWGYNGSGRLGNNSTIDSSTPVAVVNDGALVDKTIKSLDAGGVHTCVIASDNQAYCWGGNLYGRLGNNSTTDSYVPVAVDTSGYFNGLTIKEISGGSYHTCAIASDNQAYCWGYGVNGRLGNNSTTDSYVPVPVYTGGYLNGKTIKSISAGNTHTCAIASDNQAYCWGYGDSGRLGNNDNSTSYVPVPVYTDGHLSGKTVKSIRASGNHTCAIASDNQSYCWGYNFNGQLGDGSSIFSSSYVPVPIDNTDVLSGKTIKHLTSSVDASHNCVIASDEQSYCWAYNNHGQLGDGSNSQSLVPVAVDVSGVLNELQIIGLSAGQYHTCAIASDNQAYCWGYNNYGQLGNSTPTESFVPTIVNPLPL